MEADGVKGVKSTPWRKIFKNVDALNAWCEKYDAECHATSEIKESMDEAIAQVLSLRKAVFENMTGMIRAAVIVGEINATA